MRLSRFAQATAASTYVLLIVGSLVHGTGSSLACPDWPLCHGTAFPAMEHGVEYEHTHRLVAGAVAVMTTVLGILLLRDRRYRALRPLAILAPVMVLVQALLGGMTVLLRLPKAITLSHLTLSMAFFSVTVVLAIRVSQIDRGSAAEHPVADPRAPTSGPSPSGGLRMGALAAALAVLVQVFLGGLVRHSMAGLACITFPLCFGSAWPSNSSSERIHMVHRFGAVAVTVLVVPLALLVLRRSRGPLRLLALSALGLLAVQITLGVLSVTTLLHLPVVTAHLAVGALLLGSLVTTWTLLGSAPQAAAVAAHPPRPAPRVGDGVPA